jgi:hypothetical protein
MLKLRRHSVVRPGYVPRLSELCGFDDIRDFQKAHREWVEAGSSRDTAGRDDAEKCAVAIGTQVLSGLTGEKRTWQKLLHGVAVGARLRARTQARLLVLEL